MTDRQTDGQTDRRTDARGKTICLPTLKGGDIKMPTMVGILTFISMINTTSERLKPRNFFKCGYFSFNEQLKFRAQLS